MEVILFIIGIWVIIAIFSWISETISNSKKYLELKPRLDSLDNSMEVHGRSIDSHNLKIEKDKEEFLLRQEGVDVRIKQEWDVLNKKKEKQKESLIEEREELKKDFEKIAKQKSMGFPWLAEAFADYLSLRDQKLARYLEKKSHPAYSAAENVRIIREEKKELIK